MSRNRAWRRAQRQRIIARRLGRVRNWQLTGSGSGYQDNPLHPWYQSDPWPQADVIGRFAEWNPLVCCHFCQYEQYTPRPRWHWDGRLPEEASAGSGGQRGVANLRRWVSPERARELRRVFVDEQCE